MEESNMESCGGRARNVNISVEKLLEQEIEEISRTGEEKYRKPFTLSEELTDLAHKIDFGEDKETEENDNEPEAENAENKNDQIKNEKWPWESVRNKIRTALSEVCVLLDVLQVIKEKKYLVMEPVTQNPEPPKQAVQMIGKRKSLAKAAEFIRLGAERMSKNEDEQKNAITDVPILKTDYFSELMKLRQKWRIKKTGNSITGDLSYKSAGSNFWHPGLFEVKKTEDVPEDERDDSGCPLTVRVSSDVEGFSRVLVKIIDLTEMEPSASIEKEDVKMEIESSPNDSNAIQSSNNLLEVSPWHRKLKQAQYNLFCKELFSQISREAFQSSNLDSAEVNGNTIKLQLGRDAFASIIYEHGRKEEEYSYENVMSGHGDSLEYRLQQLLHEKHMKQIDTPTPRPSTAAWLSYGQSVGNYHQFLAKKNATLKQKGQCLLESFAEELKHIILRRRTNRLLDRLSTEYSDPFISTTWSAQSGPKSSYVTIHLISKRQRLAHRTSYHLTVGIENLKIIDMDGNIVKLSGDMKNLENFFKTQILVHFSKVALGVFEQFGWTVLQHPNNYTARLDALEMNILARAPKENCTITLTVGEDKAVQVHLQKPLAESKDNGVVSILDTKFTKFEGKPEKLDWNSQYGKTFVEKLYCLIASLS